MVNKAASWLSRHHAVVIFFAFLCGLVIAEAPTVILQQHEADLIEQTQPAERSAIEFQLASARN